MSRFYRKQFAALKSSLGGFILCAFSVFSNANTDLLFTGKAYDPETMELLYVEHHHTKLSSAGDYIMSQVNYFDADGQPIATKYLDFSDSQIMPSLSFIDKRINTKIEVEPFDRGKQTHVRIRKVREGEMHMSEVKTEDPSTSIIDGGFNLYALANWQKLLEGAVVEMEFLALTRSEYIGFKLEGVNLGKNTDKEQIVLSLSPQNFFIRLLMEPIYLSYDASTKRLMRFEGLTNIEMVEQGVGLGDNFVARIEYTYP